MKKLKRKEWHTPNTQKGMGDYYGTGIKNPMGIMRDDMLNILPKKGKMKPPKSLA